MLKSITDRALFASTLDWARAEYAAIQQVRRDFNPTLDVSTEPGPKSALFSRLLAGKLPLSFPPPLSFGQPWYEIVEAPGAFDVLVAGTLPSGPHATDTQHHLEYLVINGHPWIVLHGNDAAASLSGALGKLRHCADRSEGEEIIGEIEDSLKRFPEWVVRAPPWPEYRVYLGRGRRQGKRGDLDRTRFFRETLDGTNRVILRTLIDGKKQADGKAERIAHLLAKPDCLLTAYERKVVADLHNLVTHSADNDWLEYECDVWQMRRL